MKKNKILMKLSLIVTLVSVTINLIPIKPTHAEDFLDDRGFAIIPIGEGDDISLSMAIQLDEKIIVGGFDRGGDNDFPSVHNLPDGNLDTSNNQNARIFGGPSSALVRSYINGSFYSDFLCLNAEVPYEGETSECTSFSIANAPSEVTITNPLNGDLFQYTTQVNLAANFVDPGMQDSHTCEIDWGPSIEAGLISETDGSGTCNGSYSYNDAGVYNVKVTVMDNDGGIGQSTVMLVVYNPDAGFVTGGGWIDSPEGAYMPDEYPTGNTFFLNTFDTDPPLSLAAIDGAWYPDRYPPSAFESKLFDGDNRLNVKINTDDYLPHGSIYYNYQGQKFNLQNDLNTYITADLYIGPDWENSQRHASLWSTTHDTDGNLSGYPIAGFTAGKGFRIFTQDTDQDTSNGYQPDWYDIELPEGFSYGAWYTIRAELTETAYRYYINGELVWTDIVTLDSVLWTNMMLQAYNYGEDYDVYWDNVGAGRIGDFPIGKATFGFVSKYKKGADVPMGNTEFQFHSADLNFHISSYDWLVVTGSNYAKFKGIGTINGEGEYKFQIRAGDNDPDTFRMKIWYEDNGNEVVVYDNGINQEIGGGSIVVHTKKK